MLARSGRWSELSRLLGCQEILNEVEIDFDEIWMAQGTCTTSSGVLMSLKENQRLHVVPVLKGFDVLETMKPMHFQMFDAAEWEEMLSQKMTIHPEAHFGGYAKTTEVLLDFILEVKETECASIRSSLQWKGFLGNVCLL